MSDKVNLDLDAAGVGMEEADGATSRGKKVETAGNFIMVSSSVKFDYTDKATGETRIVQFPNRVGKGKDKHLTIYLCMKVADKCGVGPVAPGDTMYTQFILIPSSDLKESSKKSIYNIAKNRLLTLGGQHLVNGWMGLLNQKFETPEKKLDAIHGFIDKYIISKFAEKPAANGSYKLISEGALKQQVICEVRTEVYQNKGRLKIINIRPFYMGAKSTLVQENIQIQPEDQSMDDADYANYISAADSDVETYPDDESKNIENYM